MATKGYTSCCYWQAMVNASLCKFFILKALHDEPLHGYQLIRRVAELSGRCCTPTEGAVYPVLREFERCGCVLSRRQTVHGRTRKVYRITAKGRAALRTGRVIWIKAFRTLQHVMKNETLK